MTKLSSRGELHYQPLLGEHESDPSQVALDQTIFGLPWSAIYIYGSVRDEDGNLYTFLRNLTCGDGGRKRFFLQSTLGGSSDLKMHEASRNSVRNLNFSRSFENGIMRLKSDPAQPGAPFSFQVTAKTTEWVEEGVMRLHGTLVEPGLQWHVPHKDQGYYYVSQLYDVEGEILGKPVKGFFGADDMYMHGQVYENDLLIGKKLHTSWYTWTTRYKDDSLDGGHFMLGHDGFRFAVLCDEKGNVFETTNVKSKVTLDPTGTWPERIDVDADGQLWEFLPDPRGRMVDFMPMPNPQTEGRWRKVGDTREPSHWFAFGEIAPSHGTEMRKTLFGS